MNKHKRYRREKPWDHDGIEHWKIEVRGGGEQVQELFSPRVLELLQLLQGAAKALLGG